MNNLLVKTCGISDLQSLKTALAYGASHIGFVFFAKSPRNISINQAIHLAQFTKNKAKSVAVTVNATDLQLETIIKAIKPDLLQFHGNESATYIKEVKIRYQIKVMKSFSIRQDCDFNAIAPYIGTVDWLLFDSKPPELSFLPGGNGVSFDWKLLSGKKFPVPYMLSGGLNVDNVITALEQSNARAIDVSSGIENQPGIKDTLAIKRFLTIAKSCTISNMPPEYL